MGSGARTPDKPNRRRTTMTPETILPLCVCSDPECAIPYGLCHCKCGGKTKNAQQTIRKRNLVQGLPRPYLRGHSLRMVPALFENPDILVDEILCKKIPLSKGGFAIVDAADYERISYWKWYETDLGYVARVSRKGDGGRPKRTIFLHNQVMGCIGDAEPDHRNQDKKDNRKCNLRPSDRSQNTANKGLKSTNTTGFKGVTRSERIKGCVYYSSITCRGIRYSLGKYENPEDAAYAYDFKAIELFGEFACLNFPKQTR